MVQYNLETIKKKFFFVFFWVVFLMFLGIFLVFVSKEAELPVATLLP
tara:strand:- start:1128 stop:1268 length:141 start_codon:yes stop_codon:yes gene_type:complete